MREEVHRHEQHEAGAWEHPGEGDDPQEQWAQRADRPREDQAAERDRPEEHGEGGGLDQRVIREQP